MRNSTGHGGAGGTGPILPLSLHTVLQLLGAHLMTWQHHRAYKIGLTPLILSLYNSGGH